MRNGRFNILTTRGLRVRESDCCASVRRQSRAFTFDRGDTLDVQANCPPWPDVPKANRRQDGFAKSQLEHFQHKQHFCCCRRPCTGESCSMLRDTAAPDDFDEQTPDRCCSASSFEYTSRWHHMKSRIHNIFAWMPVCVSGSHRNDGDAGIQCILVKPRQFSSRTVDCATVMRN